MAFCQNTSYVKTKGFRIHRFLFRNYPRNQNYSTSLVLQHCSRHFIIFMSKINQNNAEFTGAMKKNLVGCLIYVGDDILPSYMGIIINHDIRIPITQPGFNGKWRGPFFSWLTCLVVAFSSHPWLGWCLIARYLSESPIFSTHRIHVVFTNINHKSQPDVYK